MAMDFFILTWRWTQKKYHSSRDDKSTSRFWRSGAVGHDGHGFFYFNPAVETKKSITVPATTSQIGTMEGLVSANGLGCGGAEQLATMSMDFFILTRQWTQKKYHHSCNDKLTWNGLVSANGLGCGGAEQLATMSIDFFILTWRWTQKKYHRSRNNEPTWNGLVSANGLCCGGAEQLATMSMNFFILPQR
jgi:hypothetical protein